MLTRRISSLFVFILTVIFMSCSGGRGSSGEGSASGVVLLTVKTDTVRVFGEKQQVTFPGKIKAASDVNLAFRVAGPIARMAVSEGAFVHKGQTLAELDSRDYQIQFDATEAEYKRVKAEADRIIELYGNNSVAANDYDKAVYGLKQITAKYEAHRNALADVRLTAPFDGFVQKRFFGVGETVGAGTPVLSMIDAGSPEVEIFIPSSEFIKRDNFESYSCTVGIYPDRVFSLDLVGITQKANLNQLYAVRLKMRASEKPLPVPGMVAFATIYYKPEASELVRIPYSALFAHESASAVWVFNPETQTVTLRKIKPSEIQTNGTVVVSSGLEAGEIVVTAGVHSLKDGDKVKVLPPISPTNAGGLL